MGVRLHVIMNYSVLCINLDSDWSHSSDYRLCNFHGNKQF